MKFGKTLVLFFPMQHEKGSYSEEESFADDTISLDQSFNNEIEVPRPAMGLCPFIPDCLMDWSPDPDGKIIYSEEEEPDDFSRDPVDFDDPYDPPIPIMGAMQLIIIPDRKRMEEICRTCTFYNSKDYIKIEKDCKVVTLSFPKIQGDLDNDEIYFEEELNLNDLEMLAHWEQLALEEEAVEREMENEFKPSNFKRGSHSILFSDEEN